MDRRRNRRITALLPVRVWGIDAHGQPFAQLARAKNISPRGAILQGMLCTVKPGELVHVQLGQQKAEFRVVWVGTIGTSKQGELGIEASSSDEPIWDINLMHCSEIAGKG
jgi:hypothetical protein